VRAVSMVAPRDVPFASVLAQHEPSQVREEVAS
jgi:hypothetical protein